MTQIPICRTFTFLLLASVAGGVLIAADPPDLINYQGVLRDSADSPRNGNFDMIFRFFDAESGGSEILVDEHLAAGSGDVVVSGGLFSVRLGSGDVQDGAGVFAGDPYDSLGGVFADFSDVWLQIEIDPPPAGGGFEVLAPRVRVASTGFALNASNLDGRPAGDFLDVSATGQVKSGLLTVGGLTVTGSDVLLGAGASITNAGEDLTLVAGVDDSDDIVLMAGNSIDDGSLSIAGSATFRMRSGGGSFEWINGNSSNVTAALDAFGTLQLDGDANVGGDVKISGDDLDFPATGANLSAGIDDLSLRAGDADFDDLTLTAGNSLDDGGIDIFGDGNFELHSGNGQFTFYNRISNTLTASLDPAGDLQIAGELSVGSGVAFADGTVQSSAVFARNIISTLDAHASVGRRTSVAIGNDGNPVVSFFDSTQVRLKVARCNDTGCGSATINVVDDTGNVGSYSSIVIGTDGSPVIAYYDSTNADLKLARCTDPACAGATLTTVDGAAAGQHCSLAIGSDGNPVISYRSTAFLDLKVAHCSNTSCSAATLNTVDGVGQVGQFTSIAIGSDGNPVISYLDDGNQDLKFAQCTDPGCNGAVIRVIDSTGDVGAGTSVVIDTGGRPDIAYYDATNGDLKFANCQGPSCATAQVIAVDTTGLVGRYPSIAIGGDGNPVISYYDETNGALKLAHCNGATCLFETLTTLDDAGDVGGYTSLAIGANGLAVVSYHDESNDDLKIITHVAGPVGQPGGSRAEGASRSAVSHASFSRPVNSGDLSGGHSGSTGHPAGFVGRASGAALARDGDGNVYARSFRSSASELASIVEVVESVEAGDVLAIDPEHAGLMRLAREPADGAVIGVVAGEPGLLLRTGPPGAEASGSEDVSATPGRAPVAVSGIVACKVDAGYGAIRPGDLLTSSPTPGHAMRAGELLPGTILGKALEGIDYGTGTIRVLVMMR